VRSTCVWVGSLILTLCLGFAACLYDDTDHLISWASVDSVQVLSVTQAKARFHVFGTKPTPCHEVIEPSVVVDNVERRFSVEMRSRIDRKVTCVTVIAPHRTNVEIPVRGPGGWEFWFFGLGDTVAVGVNVPE
jgi:hypothetical protein